MRTYLGIAAMGVAACLTGPAGSAQTAPKARSAVAVNDAAETPYLGVSAKDVDADRAKALKLKEERGCEVVLVTPDSGAARAGINVGDVLLDYNGQKLEGWEHLRRLIRETPIKREVKIVVWRNGATQTLNAMIGGHREMEMGFPNGMTMIPEIKMAPASPMTPMPDLPSMRMIMTTSSLGIIGESLSQEPQLAEYFGVKDGVMIRAVNKNSAAEKAGMKAGDVIVKIDDTVIGSPQQIGTALRAARSKGTVSVTINRKGKEMTLPVTLEAGGNYRGSILDGNRLKDLFQPGRFNGIQQ